MAEIGMSLEDARRLPAVERDAALASIEERLDALLDGKVGAGRKAAAMFLAGEIYFASGRYNEAAKAFRAAEKEAKNDPLADDAALAAIQALEAGRSAETEKEWAKWLRAYGRASSASDAML
ncbi:MAG TPA: hypothetical protein VEC56_01285, partial [Candidatus Krumholzibacteria bacterium]|nr:hypothetical protein [Candidatus Krumholzibacteria bacterium]